jgi:hypothetical protein
MPEASGAPIASTNPERFRALKDRFEQFKIDSPEWVAMHALVALGYADENGMDTPEAEK